MWKFSSILLLWIAKLSVVFILFVSIGTTEGKNIGSKFIYNYDSHLQSTVNSVVKTSRHLSFKLQSKLEVTKIWQNPSNNETIFSIQVSETNVDSWYEKKSPDLVQIPDLSQNPILVHLMPGKSVQIYSTTSEIPILNWQRGLASIFLFRQENLEILETDVLGKCKTKYNLDRHGLHKFKEQCQSGYDLDDEIFGTRKYSNVKYLYKLLDSGLIDFVEIREWIEFYHNFIPEVAQNIQQRQTLTLKEQSTDTKWKDFTATDVNEALHQIEKLFKLEFKAKSIIAEPVVEKKKSKSKLKSLLSSIKKHLKTKYLASKDSAKSFIKALKSFEIASENEIKTVLKDKSNNEVLPQLMDIFGASMNTKVHDALFEYYSNPNQISNPELFERYMFALSQNSNTPDSIIRKYVEILEKKPKLQEKCQQTFLLSLATLSRKSRETELKSSVLKYLVQELLQCKTPECKQGHLRALKNTGNAIVVPILIKLIESRETDSKSALLAVEILSQFDFEILKTKIRNLDQHLLTLLKDPEKELSLKSEIIEMILKFYPNSMENVKEMFQMVKNSANKELMALSVQKWMDLAENIPTLRDLFRKSLNEQIIEWNILSHGGLSTSFSRILSQNLAGNTSFTFDLEMAGMLMKKTKVELNILRENGMKSNIAELSIFAGGLSSFVSDDTEITKNDEPNANAGLVLNVLTHQMRPYVFFNSMGELMNLYWSGAAEEKNSALQGNLMLQSADFEHFLSNGIAVKIVSRGAISFDLSGQAKMSMWSKTSESSVENSFAYVMEQDSNLQFFTSNFAQEINLDTKIGLNLDNEIDFSDNPVKTCITMTQPEVVIQQEMVSKWLEGSKKANSKLRLKKPGRTLFLNDKNNELCNQMHRKTTR